jgi:AraC family transcriptional regulator, transcriptional activator of pobA
LMYRRNTFSKSRMNIADRKKQVLSEFRKLVNNRFAELKTPKGVARELNITPNYLNAICREIYDKTVSEIIQERVILEAKRLLAHTGLSVSEITYKLGFKDNSYFGRYFKKVVGLPPEKFRTLNYNQENI